MAIVAALAQLTGDPGFAQSIDEDLWITNGTVDAVVRDGGKIYIGGGFTQVGPATGGAVPLDAATGLPLGLPRVAGTVLAVAPDGAGGWYVGGGFTHVGGIPRSNIAHIQADHTVSSWDANAIGGVYALSMSGSTLYAAGSFTSIGGQTRNGIAALDASTGLATGWDPNANGLVQTLAVDGSTVYAGGDFTDIGGQTRNRIAALDAATGLVTAWNPNSNGTVLALAVSGSLVYAGGGFTNIGGQARNNIAALGAMSGSATIWNPSANGIVHALAVDGGTVYAGGEFTTVGGQTRIQIAAMDAGTGLATAWDPNASNTVHAMTVSGSTVYVGGTFVTIGGQSRSRIAALDVTTGLATAWDPSADNIVQALAVSGSTVYAGGGFTSMGGQARNHIAALDAATGIVTAWDPNADASVFALAVKGNTVYAAGFFAVIGGQGRSRIAALDAESGAATAWNPAADGDVYELAVGGGTVYAGGAFTNIGGQTRHNVAALDASTGAATAWNPDANSSVYGLASSGSTVYAAGFFTNIGGQGRNGIAALDAATGAATAWNPNANANVNAVAVSGSTVYAIGNFTHIGGLARNFIAALDTSTGSATAWNPNPNQEVRALAVSGSTVYAGGQFTSIGGQARNFIASLDATTGAATTWNPNASYWVLTLTVSGNRAYAGGLFSSMGGLPQSRFAAISATPAISQIAPSRGGDGGAISVVLSGAGFQSGASAKLARSGQPDIPGSLVGVAVDGLGLSTTFDLAGTAQGDWDVVVTNPDLTSATLTNGFTVESSAPYEIRVNTLGPSQIRPNRRKAFDIVLENLGNSDVLGVPLWISRIPATATLELDFPVESPSQDGGEPDWATVPPTFDGPGGKYLALVIPRLPPGISVRRLYLAVPHPVTSFELDAALTPPWADGDVFRSCLGSGGVITSPSCMGAQLTAINAHLTATPGIQALSGIALWAKIAWQCEGAATLPAALAKAEQVLDFMLQPVEGGALPGGCESALVPRWQDRRLVTIVTSVDPNDKLGAGGAGMNRLIGSDQLLPYSIRFENLESATAPAQEVVVLDALDQVTLDVSTVSLGPITFGDRVLYPPPGLTSYATDVDLRPGQELIVRVGVSLDQATGVLSWSLTSIDPATGTLPEDPQAGFLPPNVTPPQGEGSVLFTVMPKPGLDGGTAIRNQATLNFDGSSLLTPEWSNTLDTTPPESHVVLPGAATTDSASFTVRWEAEGAPPDLHDYSVYVSEGGSPYRPWRVHTTATVDTITAPGGQTYAFYSLARDLSGNQEAVPATPDVQTFSRVAVDERMPLRLALEGAAPNPVVGEARVWFTLPNRERAVLEVVDVAGRRVLRREVGALGPGRHAVDVSAVARRPGLYFLRLTQGGQALHARVAVIR